MAEKPTLEAVPPTTPPTEFPSVTPRDLHPTSDIRFVMLEVGKLSSNVERLIADVKSQGEKIDQLRHAATFVKGALWLVGGVIALAALILTGRLNAVLTALANISK